MADFTFNGPSGVRPPAIDARFVVYDGGGSYFYQTTGTYLSLASVFDTPYCKFVNGHGNAQSSKLTVQPGADPAAHEAVIQLVSDVGVIGYHFYSGTSTSWQIRKNGTYITGGAHAEDVTSTQWTIEVSIDGAGLLVGKINGNTYYSGTDGSPLTGGNPGFFSGGTGVANAVRILAWTDGVPTAQVNYSKDILFSTVSELWSQPKATIKAIDGLLI